MSIPHIHLLTFVHPRNASPSIVYIRKKETENEWLRFCLGLAKMTGLKNLEIDFWNETWSVVAEEELLKGLSIVRVAEGGTFIVRVPWKEGNPSPNVEGMSFMGLSFERRAFGLEPVSMDFSRSRDYSNGHD
jgi:hypothetical protein